MNRLMRWLRGRFLGESREVKEKVRLVCKVCGDPTAVDSTIECERHRGQWPPRRPLHVEPDEVPDPIQPLDPPEGPDRDKLESMRQELEESSEGHSLAEDLQSVGGSASCYPESWGRAGAKPGVHLGPEAVEEAKSPLELAAEIVPLANAEDLNPEVAEGVERVLEERREGSRGSDQGRAGSQGPGEASTPPGPRDLPDRFLERSGPEPPPGATRDSTVKRGYCPRCGYKLPAGYSQGDQHPGCPYPH